MGRTVGQSLLSRSYVGHMSQISPSQRNRLVRCCVASAATAAPLVLNALECKEMGLTADSMDDFLDQGAAETQDPGSYRT